MGYGYYKTLIEFLFRFTDPAMKFCVVSKSVYPYKPLKQDWQIMRQALCSGNDILKKYAGVIFNAPGSIFGFDPELNSDFFKFYISRTGPFLPSEYSGQESGYPELRILNEFYSFLAERFPEFKSQKKGRKKSPFITINEIHNSARDNSSTHGMLKILKLFDAGYKKLSREEQLRLKLPYLFFCDFNHNELKLLVKKTKIPLPQLLAQLREIRKMIFSGYRKSLNAEWTASGDNIRLLYKEHRLSHLQKQFRISEENHNFDLYTVKQMELLDKNINKKAVLKTRKKHLRSIPFMDDSIGAKLLQENMETYSALKSALLTGLHKTLFPDLVAAKAAGKLSVVLRIYFLLEHLTLYSIPRGSNCPDRKRLFQVYLQSDADFTGIEMKHINACSACSMVLQFLSRCRLEKEIDRKIPSSARKMLKASLRENNRIRHFIHVAHDNSKLILFEENISTGKPVKQRINRGGVLKIPIPDGATGNEIQFRFRSGMVDISLENEVGSRLILDQEGQDRKGILRLKSGDCRIRDPETNNTEHSVQITVYYHAP